MFDFMNKKTKICLIGLCISLAILLIVFFATDDLTGEKEFSDYTQEDWSIAILPLSIIIVPGVSTLIFALFLIIPIFLLQPALMDYVKNKKFSDIDINTNFLVFDHHELKRACFSNETQDSVYLSIKEYDLKLKDWKVIEEGRLINNKGELLNILQDEYNFDEVKIFINPEDKL